MSKTRAMREVRKHFLYKGKSMKESSRKVSPKISRQRDRVQDHVIKSMRASVKGFQPKRVLDVGTGYGMNLAFLARRFGKRSRIWSVDASPAVVREMMKIMKKRHYARRVIVKHANAEQLPFKSNHFDLVISSFLVHHLSNPKRGLFEMGRVLSHGGKLIIADWRSAAVKPLMLSARDIPSPSFIIKQLKRLGYCTDSYTRRYWYLIEATK